ncbi:MAG: ferredoxin [Mycoplasmoidaceae bacterium]
MKKRIIIDKDKCISCGACIVTSPNQAIKYDENFKAEVIEELLGEEDNIVVEVCPTEAITIIEKKDDE